MLHEVLCQDARTYLFHPICHCRIPPRPRRKGNGRPWCIAHCALHITHHTSYIDAITYIGLDGPRAVGPIAMCPHSSITSILTQDQGTRNKNLRLVIPASARIALCIRKVTYKSHQSRKAVSRYQIRLEGKIFDSIALYLVQLYVPTCRVMSVMPCLVHLVRGIFEFLLSSAPVVRFLFQSLGSPFQLCHSPSFSGQ